jgi:hypothetical protein
MMKNILREFDNATAEDLSAGLNWYSEALVFARSLDDDERKAAGVIAALSPRTAWDTNKDGAKKILSAAQRHSNIVPSVAGTYHNVRKAWMIAQGEDPVIVLIPSRPNRYLKVCRFYANILGDTESVTVDGWAAKVALKDAPTVVCGKQYLRIEKMYQKAAQVIGTITPRDLQAVCWVSIRRKSTDTEEV